MRARLHRVRRKYKVLIRARVGFKPQPTALSLTSCGTLGLVNVGISSPIQRVPEYLFHRVLLRIK